MLENVPNATETKRTLECASDDDTPPDDFDPSGHIEMEIRTGSMTAHFDDEGTVTAL